nr:immunoglobulin heavy chain junction region [Macaca mulatta]
CARDPLPRTGYNRFDVC